MPLFTKVDACRIRCAAETLLACSDRGYGVTLPSPYVTMFCEDACAPVRRLLFSDSVLNHGSGAAQQAANHFCPNPPSIPVAHSVPLPALETSGANQRAVLAASAAILVGSTAIPWYAKVLGWASRAASIAGLVALDGAACVFGLLTIGPVITPKNQDQQNWI